ncbi:hypothetical protein EDD53_0354 [Pacificibacter maritimus]|uniref:Uncharacterized protein n=1 Tax=Pacificibacter maritimus TaxID=762213 RepID=A0A3N4UUS2_9RHOB|nr:DUF1223 domain-containing protein [Pacificibacter maritimus]RPE71239.1 hypothetical protein EDD53_0354 [Pacificibacter maritimus]
MNHGLILGKPISFGASLRAIAIGVACVMSFVVAQKTVAQDITIPQVQSEMPAGQSHPVVVELFTSQGCSSCPPADALIAEIANRDDILALALHVDYWDYIGWKDIFAAPEYTQRQRDYARAAGHRTIYTPQMVVGGVNHVVGYKPMKLADLIAAQGAKANDAPVGLSAARDGGALSITLTPNAIIPSQMKVQVVQFMPLEKVSIRSGENKGKTIEYANTVTSWRHVSDWDGTVKQTVNLTSLTSDPVAVIVQEHTDGAPGKIVAALRID